MNILADATLPGLEEAFPSPFKLTTYSHLEEVASLLPGQDVLLCRANLKVNEKLLHNSRLRYVATASSGTDHLDHEWLASQSIHIIDAKGCNARAVTDYVVSCLAYLQQQQLIAGNKAGVIGMGKVGSQVHRRLQALGFQTLAYDPPQNMFAEVTVVDVLCIHAELHDVPPYPSRNLIDRNFLSRLKPGCIIINAARGGIIDENALLESQFIYCTDVYLNEPNINPRILDKATLCTPHIAGHSLEAKYQSVAMVSHALHQIMGLPIPQFAVAKMENAPYIDPHTAWQEQVLKLYNPLVETMQLKQAVDKESTFLKLRQKHNKRHDFSCYAALIESIRGKLL